MKQFEKIFQDIFINNTNEYEYKNLKEKRPKYYNSIISTINEVIKKSIISDSLILTNYKFTKLTLKINKPKTLVFCGHFLYKGENVILLENKTILGTFYSNDTTLVNHLKNMRIGTLLQLEKTKDFIELVLPHEVKEIGLFK